MTERCQNKFRDKFENNNKNYTIYIAVLVGSLAVLYFYRFHLATIAFSYLLGCLGCYYCINSSVFIKYIEQLNHHATEDVGSQAEKESSVKKSCDTCGSPQCARHDEADAAPWVGLKVHKQLDQAIQDLYNAILEQFVSSWYSKLTLQPFFVDELRHQLRYASACLLRRINKCDIPRFLLERALPCVLQHCRATRPHAAVGARRTELNYFRAVTDAIMPYLLKDTEVQNPVFHVLVRELLANWALLPLSDALSAPHTINTLILLAGEPSVAPNAAPHYYVEFLETFVRQSERLYLERLRLWRLHLDAALSDQQLLYALMQHLKGTANLSALQLYIDIKSFQNKILNPELSADAEAALRGVARDLCRRHLAAPGDELRRELLALADLQPGSVKRLQTSRALYQRARQAHDFLEKLVLPRFLHSEEFYKLMIGSRLPTGYQKQDKRPQQPKPIRQARLKQSLEGEVLSSLNQSLCDSDSLDHLQLLGYLQAFDSELPPDLSTFRVVLTDVEVKPQVPPRRGTVRVFSVLVHRAQPAVALWTLARSEHDFHLLRTKLLEFHGDGVLSQLVLPNRRDNSPLETLRYKYEDFLQQLLRRPLLQTSQLLSLFLTAREEFSLAAASTLTTSSDLTNIYQSVTRRLRKEKGQHLESFLTNLLISSDIERYQSIKLGPQVEEAVEVNEDVTEVTSVPRPVRDITSPLFPDTSGAPARVVTGEVQQVVFGFSRCLVFFLSRVVNAPAVVSRVACACAGLLEPYGAARLRTRLLRAACPARLARVVHLARDLVVCPRAAPAPRAAQEARARAQAQLLRRARAVPPLARVLATLFNVLQDPVNNKHLVYSLLDLCLLELFPELEAAGAS